MTVLNFNYTKGKIYFHHNIINGNATQFQIHEGDVILHEDGVLEIYGFIFDLPPSHMGTLFLTDIARNCLLWKYETQEIENMEEYKGE